MSCSWMTGSMHVLVLIDRDIDIDAHHLLCALRGHFENAIALIFRNSSASGYSCAGFLPCGEHERSFYFWHYKQDIFPRTIPNTMITAQHLLATPFASTMDCSGVACVSQAHAYRIDADYFCGLSIRSTYFSGTTTLDEDLRTTVSVTFG